MHVASLCIFPSYLRQQIVNHTAEDEMYVQIKDKLQQQIIDHTTEDEMYVQIKDNLRPQSLEKKYEGYKLE